MSQPKILIVEDERIVAEDLKNTLTSLGYDVLEIISSGELAITTAGTLRPDLILMDIMLEGEMDGISAAEKIRGRYDIPVIFLTAYADEGLIQRAKLTGPSSYIIKPFNEREIHSNIEISLYRHMIEAATRRNEATIRGLLNATKDEVVLTTMDGKILAVNEAFAGRCKMPAESLIGTIVYECIPTGGISMRTAEEMQKRHDGPVAFEEDLQGNWFDTTVYFILDSGGNPQQIAVFRHDISEKKRAEHELATANEQLVAEKEQLAVYAAALDNMRDAVVLTSSMGEIRYLNATAEKKFGVRLQDMKGKKLRDLAHPENLLNLGDEFFVSYKDADWQGVFLGKNAYGVKLPLTITGKPVLFFNNRPTWFAFVLREKMG